MILTTEIIDKLKSNDRKTITDLYRQIFSILMSVAVRYKKNEEDQKTIVNDAFINILKNINTYQIELPFIPWAKRITNNIIIDSYRKEKNYTSFFDFDSENVAVQLESENEIDEHIENERLRYLLNSLPPATNLVFNLYAIEEYSIKEICSELNIGYETVKWHLKEGRKRLRLLLQVQKAQEIH